MTARRDPAAGFSYLEVMIASVILAGAVTCMGLALEQSATVSANAPIAATGDYLLQDGVAWARSLRRLDATGSTALGMEAGETLIAHIDDVDDLAGLVETNPVDRIGTAYGTRWRRAWTVVSAQIANPALTAAAGSTPLLRIDITVSLDGAVIASDTILLSRTP